MKIFYMAQKGLNVQINFVGVVLDKNYIKN